MRKLGLLLLVALPGFLVAGDAPEEAIKKDRDRLKGAWKMMAYEVNGQKVPQRLVLNIDPDGKFTIEAGGTVVEATTKIDPTKKPKTIDFVFTEGELQGKTALGIYEIEEDTFKYCRSAPDKPRPTDFSTKEGSEETLATYRRGRAK